MTLPFDIRSVILSDIGKKKKNNEDYADSFEPENAQDIASSGRLFIVADGVGGAAMGERASRYAVQTVLHAYYQQPEYQPAERLKQAIRQANSDIYRFAEDSSPPVRMATTIVCALVLGDRLMVASVGDSRAYLLRGNEAHQITRDHNTIGDLVRDGELSEEEALHSNRKNTLYRAIGAEDTVAVDLFTDIPLQPGDKILLCSDGLTRYALGRDIAGMTAVGSLEEIARRLVDFANDQAGADNITVALIEVQAGGSTPRPPLVRVQNKPPSGISLEDMDTQPYVKPARKPGVVMMPRGRLLWLVAAVFMAAIGITLGIGSLISPQLAPEAAALLEATTSPTTTTWRELTASPTAKTSSKPGTPVVETIFTPVTEEQPAGDLATPTDFLPLTGTDLPQPTEVANSVCVYRVKSGDTINGIMNRFKSADPGPPYYEWVCQEDPIQCSKRAPLEYPDDIDPNQYIEIPDMASDACESKGGQWATIIGTD